MTSHDLLDDLITLAQILSCNSFPFQTLFFPVLYICFLMIQTMWVRHANDGKNECLVKIKKNDYVTVTFRPKSSGAHNLTPYVKKLKPPKREQLASEAMYFRWMRLPRQQCSSLLEPCFIGELPN